MQIIYNEIHKRKLKSLTNKHKGTGRLAERLRCNLDKSKKIAHKLLIKNEYLYRMPLPVTKIVVISNETSFCICPKCECCLDREYMAFCDCCGQKLNWDLLPVARITKLN